MDTMMYQWKRMERTAQNMAALFLQMSLALHQHYLHVYFAVTLVLFIYKGIMFPYPPTGAFTWDVIFLFLYYIVSSTRLFHASKGNKTRHIATLVFSLILTIPVFIGNIYYIQLQSYVLRLEQILNGGALFLICWETLLTILALLVLLGRTTIV